MNKTKKTAKKKQKTIPFSELKALSFCNSKRLPPYVRIGSQVKHWVGIGWIDIDDDDEDLEGMDPLDIPTVVEG